MIDAYHVSSDIKFWLVEVNMNVSATNYKWWDKEFGTVNNEEKKVTLFQVEKKTLQDLLYLLNKSQRVKQFIISTHK